MSEIIIDNREYDFFGWTMVGDMVVISGDECLDSMRAIIGGGDCVHVPVCLGGFYKKLIIVRCCFMRPDKVGVKFLDMNGQEVTRDSTRKEFELEFLGIHGPEVTGDSLRKEFELNTEFTLNKTNDINKMEPKKERRTQSTQEKSVVLSFYWQKVAAGVSISDANAAIQVSFEHNEDWIGVDDYLDSSRVFPPNFDASNAFWRIKPKTVTHPGGKHPEPCRSPKDGVTYYFADASSDGYVASVRCFVGHRRLPKLIADSGCLFEDTADAKSHASVLFCLDSKVAQ